MKNLFIGLITLSTLPSALAFDPIVAVSTDSVSIYLPAKPGKSTVQTCKEEPSTYEKTLNDLLKSGGMSGSFSVIGAVEINPAGYNCYLIIKLSNSSYTLTKTSDESTSCTGNAEERAKYLNDLTVQISKRPGYVLHVSDTTDKDCGIFSGSRYLVDSVYLTPKP